jgi:diguanylate cyclase (GGDEF)-like protein/PAS domain S-box-containing protein
VSALGPVPPDGLDDALLRTLAAATDELIVIVDGEGRILLANPALQRFTGRSAQELLGRRFFEVYVVPEHVALARDAVTRALATGAAPAQEADWLTGSGERRSVAMCNTVLVDRDGRPFAVGCTARDVTDERAREARLSERARTDGLTGLANRGALFEALQRNLAEGPGCAVLFCDLDQFKRVNDDHGHAVGDRLLADVADRLLAAVGASHLVGRFGGDEFVVICSGADEESLTRLVERVNAAVSDPFPGPRGPLTVGVSVGVAVGWPGETADELIARADLAMYGVKTHRRRRAARDEQN